MTTSRLALCFALVFLVCLPLTPSSHAATAPALDASGGHLEERQQLRTLLEQMEKGIGSLDVEAVIKLMTPDAIVTWQNAEVSRGPEQIRGYYNRMLKGSSPIVKKFSTKATLGGPAVFHADSAIAWGTTVDEFELADGTLFTLNANWSTTVVKQNGQWKVAALHFSTNLFDNPMLNKAQSLIKMAAIAGVLGGFLLAFLATKFLGKK